MTALCIRLEGTPEERARKDRAASRKARELWADALPARREGATDGRLALTRADPDAPFCRPELSDDALTAAVWTCAKFDRRFPGWQLYRRVMTGHEAFDADLLAWAVGCARKLARAKTTSGRDYLRTDARGPWIAWAAADALYAVIYGRYPVMSSGGLIRGVRFSTYARIRDPITAGITRGLECFRGELHYHYFRTRKAYLDEKVPYHGTNMARVQTAHAGDVHAFRLFGDGNAVTRKEPVHD